MTNRIINLLKNTSGITDYRVNTVRTESYELFFVHKNLETVRSTDTCDYKVTVYVAHDDKLGEASFPVYSSYTDEKIVEEIEFAKQKALLIFNQTYNIPTAEKDTFESDSNFECYEPSNLAALISKACFEADNVENGSINALEVFVYKHIVSVYNSRGVEKTQTLYNAMVEAIPTYTNGESVELYEQHNFTEFNYDAIVAEIAQKMTEVKDRFFAKPPQDKLTCKVVLCEQEIGQLVQELVSELNFAAVYSHSNAFSVGDQIQKNASGDLLDVTTCARLLGSTRSMFFDNDGVTLTDRRVIENGKAVAYFGSTRYAQYLGEQATGNLGCIKVAAGTLTDSELKSEPYFRCASMSGLQVDIYNDYIGGEVRLGYYFDGEKEIPLTGVSISGKLSDALANLRLSTSVVTSGAYNGPKFARFDKIEIV